MNYLGDREESNLLYQIIKDKQEKVDIAYRGIMYRKEELKVGQVYIHWNMDSSWTLDKKVAKGFANDGYVPEDMITKLAEERNISEDDAYNQYFIPITLVWRNAIGFVPNHHFDHLYKKEEEVLVYDGEFEILTHKEDKFYIVEVKNVLC